jgi:hypothetical protein
MSQLLAKIPFPAAFPGGAARRPGKRLPARVAILAALSPHPKFPFLAHQVRRSKPAAAPLEQDLGVDQGRCLECELSLRVQPKRFELPTPFRRSVARRWNFSVVRGSPVLADQR